MIGCHCGVLFYFSMIMAHDVLMPSQKSMAPCNNHNDDPHESAAALFIYSEEHTSSRPGRHRLKHQKLVFGIGFHASLCSF